MWKGTNKPLVHFQPANTYSLTHSFSVPAKYTGEAMTQTQSVPIFTTSLSSQSVPPPPRQGMGEGAQIKFVSIVWDMGWDGKDE